MSMIGLMASMAKRKGAKLFGSAEPAGRRVDVVPLKLHQLAVIDINIAPFIIAESLGGRMPSVESNQTVVAVGKFNLFGMSAYRSYLSDGRSFIQTVSSPKSDNSVGISECRLYTLQRDEQTPQTEAEWADLLAESDGWVGHYTFGVPKDQNNPAEDVVWYPRLWSPSDKRISPVSVQENIFETNGSSHWAKHQMMQYGRQLGSTNDPSEYLLPTVSETSDGAVFDIWIGIDLLESMLTVTAI